MIQYSAGSPQCQEVETVFFKEKGYPSLDKVGMLVNLAKDLNLVGQQDTFESSTKNWFCN